MTAEIAIMNKRAIALATDSAVTIGERNRFYNTANKLFMLSKFQPVGIMIYNNAEFMGIPWETIIKEYRKELDINIFDNLSDYGEDFIKYLNSQYSIFENYEENYYCQVVCPFISEISNTIDNECKSLIEINQRELNNNEIKGIIHNKIDYYYDIINNKMNLNDIPTDLTISIKDGYHEKFEEIMKEILGVENIDVEYVEKLEHISNMIFTKDIFIDGYTGIVIAGFGSKDIFPSLISYVTSGAIKGYLKYKKDKFSQINNEKDYDIIPFAQSDTVNTFLYGISESYLEVIEKSFDKHIIKTLSEMDNSILSEKNKAAVKNDLLNKWQLVVQAIVEYSQDHYFIPILKAIRTLPIEELASMAESLVNLTSFKRKVAVDENSYTVGGPIDVAVISKGDGFVWIKRKHYFSSEYNHHFFENYYKDLGVNKRRE
jgi:hypothetical protein